MRKITVGKLISSARARRLDKIAIEKFLIPPIVLMENAGKNAAEIALENFNAESAVIFCGGGNNGGDGFVIARHFFNRGIKIKVYITQKISGYSGSALINLTIIQKMGISIIDLSKQKFPSKLKIPNAGLIIDALLGTGTKGKIKEPYKKIIRKINSAKIPVVSVDIPSGIDADTGKILGEAVEADMTVTMVAAKKGLAKNAGKKHSGKVIVTGIGINFDL